MTFAKRWAGLEEQKAALLEEVYAWPDAMRTAQPADDGWSAVQVLDHLVRTEIEITRVIAETLQQPLPVRVRDRLGFLFVERVMLSELRVKVPQSVRTFVTPGDGPELAEIAVRWDAGRVRLAEVAREAYTCRSGVFRHPVSGRMNFDQVLRFFSVHMVHHGYQLKRIKAGR